MHCIVQKPHRSTLTRNTELRLLDKQEKNRSGVIDERADRFLDKLSSVSQLVEDSHPTISLHDTARAYMLLHQMILEWRLVGHNWLRANGREALVELGDRLHKLRELINTMTDIPPRQFECLADELEEFSAMVFGNQNIQI